MEKTRNFLRELSLVLGMGIHNNFYKAAPIDIRLLGWSHASPPELKYWDTGNSRAQNITFGRLWRRTDNRSAKLGVGGTSAVDLRRVLTIQPFVGGSIIAKSHGPRRLDTARGVRHPSGDV
jgi:hypothetical protein